MTMISGRDQIPAWEKVGAYREHVTSSLNEKACRMQEKNTEESHTQEKYFVNHFGKKMRE